MREATAPGESESIDVDCCALCRGVWIDGAELSRASPRLGEVFGKRRGYAASSRPSGLACPRCDGALCEIGVNDVAVDWCRVCFGVWLDGGEYQAIAFAPRRRASAAMVACEDCQCQVSLGDTYFTEHGPVCSACRDHAASAAQADGDVAAGVGLTSDELAQLRQRLRSSS